MAKSNYLENKILDHVLGNTPFTQPASLYVALFTSDPGEAGGGTEVTGGGYARQPIDFNAASGGSATSDGQVDFSNMPASTVTHMAIYDASTSGNLLYYGVLGSPKTIEAGNTATLADDDLTISED